jgi:hypothetical protein
MANRIPRQTLFLLRNDIPIDFIITDFLCLPCKISEGFLRFLCPLCQEFNSATGGYPHFLDSRLSTILVV